MSSTTETAEGAAKGHEHGDDEHHEHVVPVALLGAVLVALLCLTIATYLIAFVHLGPLNTPVAILIATIKASLVAAFFMHLRWDKPINALVLGLSLFLLALFLGMSMLDTSQYQRDIIPEYSENQMAMEHATMAAEAAQQEGGGAEAPEAAPAVPDDAQSLLDWARKTFVSKLGKEQVYELPKQWPSPDYELTQAKIDLGRLLYWDPRLSTADDISCSTCHDLAKFGVDPRGTPTSAGHEGQMGTRNAPTVYNAALHTMQFWDGRAPTVEAQAVMPITNSVEMAMPNPDAVVAKLKGIAGYAEPFKAAFGEDDPITIDHVGEAIGAFERCLLTPSPFDAFLKGDLKALSKDEYDGLRSFKETNCIMCHRGLGIGGTMKQMLGLQGGYGGHPGEGEMFKVPGLRNVTETAPYMHDGSVDDLHQVVHDMAKYQLGQELNPGKVKSIVTFLGSLKGTPPADLIGKPKLPE